MEENRKGFIMSVADIEQAARVSHENKAGGHHNMQGHGFLTVASEAATHGMRGKELSKHLMLGLDKLRPGGGIEEHYHEFNAQMPVFDHVYYVISGRIRATVGATERTVGADSLIYCPSNVKHAILNVGKTTAKVLRISGCNEGAKMGGATYTKK
jgi:quercetin dioxygenase-like cupin family protein